MSGRKPVLQEIGRALGESTTLGEAAYAFAAGAVEALGAVGGYVEYRIADPVSPPDALAAPDSSPGVVEVLASVGLGVPPAGLRVPHPGSLTPEVLRSRESAVVEIPDGAGEHMAPHLMAATGTEIGVSPGLLVPLMGESGVQGALVLRRRTGDEPFTDADAEQARSLGDLAGAALRRTELIEALRDSEERFRQIAENIREFIWLSDPGFTRHFYVNVAYEHIWGRSRASLYADPVSLLDGVHPDDRSRVADAIAGMAGGEYDLEYRVVRPDGEVRHVSSRGVPVLNDRGEITRIAGITEDITERKQAQLERDRLFERERAAREASEFARATVEQRQLELERVSQSRTRLLRGFTHDVKNPLGAADGFLALLAEGVRGELSPGQAQAVERARRAISSALDLINHSLELARAESGQLEIARVPVDVAEVASEIAEEFRAEAEAKGLSMTVEQPPPLPMIESDPARVGQVLANLLSNAVKYTPPGGSVTLRAGRREQRRAPGSGEHLVIDVADTGPGISREQQATLFEEFTRFNPGAAHGSGIGLAISRHVARALGGTITVDSEPGAGSVFSFWLPIGR